MVNKDSIYTQKDVVKQGKENGVLQQHTFAVKDVFAVEGIRSTAGNPDWLRTHSVHTSSAPVITALLNAGASLDGMTITDELMYSLHGENAHYGTPPNPRDASRIPGGSSSGSAAAAAAELASFTIGTDTGGSVRVPSSYCGLYGFRPTHASITMEGIIPLAPSFDTVGWMSTSPKTLASVGQVLLENKEPAAALTEFLLPEEAWELADHATAEALLPFIPGSASRISLSASGLPAWAEVFRVIQAGEIWETHGDWVKETRPKFGPGIKERFEMAETISPSDKKKAAALHSKIQQDLHHLLGKNKILLLPTVPGIAPLRNLPEDTVNEIRKRTLQLCCIAGLGGLPQVTVPVKTTSGYIGLSAVAGPGMDHQLLDWSVKFNAAP